MWKCPKCGREFKNTNQGHYCGEKPETVDEYILSQDEEKRSDLQTLRRILRAALPDAEERIAWSMPTYRKGHNICYFAASKKHVGYYVGTDAVEHFAERLAVYKTEKGTVRIPYGQIDEELVAEIARWCDQTGHHA